MKKILFLSALLVSSAVIVRAAPTDSSPLNSAGYVTPQNKRRPIDAANQQIANAAQTAAAQAAAYAKQAAPYKNESAKQSAAYADQAAAHAQLAAYVAAYPKHHFNARNTFSPGDRAFADLYPNDVKGRFVSLEQESAYAAQAAANAKKAATQAAAQAEIDSAVSKLENERDEAIAKLKVKFAPSVSELESQAAAIEQKAKALEIVKSSIFVTNHNVKPGPNYRVVNGQTYEISHSELWKSPLELAGFKTHNNADGHFLAYFVKVRTVEPDKIQCRVYEQQVDWPPVATGENGVFVQEIVIYHYPNAESLVSGQNLGNCRCMRVANYISGGISRVALDCGVQATKGVTEVVRGSPDAATLNKIDDNQRQLSAVKLKLSQVSSNFDKEREPIVASYAAKIKDVPKIFAQQVEEKEDAKKQAAVDKVVKFNQDAADKGDPVGLLRMGERYRDGDGVEIDLAKAKDYLTKAAAAGSLTAADELKMLPAN